MNYIPLPCRQLTVLDLSRSPNAPRVSSKSHPLSHSTFSFPHLCALISTSGAKPRSIAVRHCSLHPRPIDAWSLVPTRIASRYFVGRCLFLCFLFCCIAASPLCSISLFPFAHTFLRSRQTFWCSCGHSNIFTRDS